MTPTSQLLERAATAFLRGEPGIAADYLAEAATHRLQEKDQDRLDKGKRLVLEALYPDGFGWGVCPECAADFELDVEQMWQLYIGVELTCRMPHDDLENYEYVKSTPGCRCFLRSCSECSSRDKSTKTVFVPSIPITCEGCGYETGVSPCRVCIKEQENLTLSQISEEQLGLA